MTERELLDALEQAEDDLEYARRCYEEAQEAFRSALAEYARCCCPE